ncbi:BglG family transcription antiterminator [Halalkalibacter urbisdiaboli]|uniref:BglG family transcription antiterminator n=1 Tax=Halalkalibacter urbisdiaboli TaxID=1960589 RepID=UPI000B44A3A5|nr:PRD domain-containing protein [Halalkalibacter urbisdiaboli]
MYISARERKILEFLLNTNEDLMTVKDVADELSVSPRTVHRDLKGVEETLREYGLELTKKSGMGIQVTGDEENIDKLKMYLFNLNHNEYTPEERQTIIFSELLDTTEPVKLIALANDLNVTIATISNDLNKIEDRLAGVDLALVRKRGYGVEIIGSESAKRRAMSKLITENIDEFEFISMIKETIQKKSSQTVDTVTDRLLGLVEKKKLHIIEKQIDLIKNELPYSIADSAYIGLVVHLALAIERILQGEDINFDHEYLNSLKDTKEFKVAEKIVAGLEEVFRIKISHGEIGYITMHLMGAKLRNDHDDLLEDTSLQIGLLAQHLIRFVSRELNRDLTKNQPLFQGLVAHLRPALYRIKQKMGISNPLLSRIQDDYQELFSILEKGVKEIFTELHVPKEEIGYLVMHFASALLNKGEGKDVNILVVCSSGIGTSKMLSTQLEREIPGLKTVSASLFDLDRMNVKEFDTIVSTIPLKDLNENYVIVSPLLSKEEIAKIKRSLLNKEAVIRTNTRGDEGELKPLDSNIFLQEIERTRNYTSAIYHLLHGFNIFELPEQLIEESLKYLCEQLYEQNVVTNVKGVLADLLKREEIGGLGIPGTTLALYHTRSDDIRIPSFIIGRLANTQTVKAMDDSDLAINTILLMLSPKTIDDETLEILSGISSLIIRDEASIEHFQSSSKEEILKLLASELKEIYQTKGNK